MELPVFGQEEDAADTASILLIDTIFDTEAVGDDIALSDGHSPDLQRYYNLVCQLYRADPDIRHRLGPAA